MNPDQSGQHGTIREVPFFEDECAPGPVPGSVQKSIIGFLEDSGNRSGTRIPELIRERLNSADFDVPVFPGIDPGKGSR